ncbi:MAG: SDR family oxidoreductase [Candidatus Krumholzibacteriota bacterium]|nr:SDR family oxidoreductase [Candidatus Krumholzibacteriota bacterium]
MRLEDEKVLDALEELVERDPLTRIIHGENRYKHSNVLLLGGGGFLGTALARLLIENEHNVTVLDRFLYGNRSLDSISSSVKLNIYTGDIRDVELLETLIRGKDTVINLAAIVGDEACRINPAATRQINTEAVGTIARIAKKQGVKRIIHASTCSTYGKGENSLLNEDSELLPLSLYAESKVESEKLLLAETGGGHSPACCIFRFSTLFGFSRRPRFDLVVNTLTGNAWKNGKIRIFGGAQWRPLLHVADAARAIRKAVESRPEKIAGKIYNTGGEDLNLTIKEVGEIIRKLIPGTELETDEQVSDERDYRIDFTRIREEMDFTPEISISNGVFELVHALDNGEEIDPELPVYSNYKWLNANTGLLETEAEILI